MNKLTKNQILEIDLYLKQRNFFYIDLRAEILDAICCELEENKIIEDEQIRVFLDSNLTKYKGMYKSLSKTNIKHGVVSYFNILLKPTSFILLLILNVALVIFAENFNDLNFVSDSLIFSIIVNIILQPLFIKLPYYSVQNLRKISTFYIIPFVAFVILFKILKLPNFYFVSLFLNSLFITLLLFYFELKITRNKVKKYQTN